MELTVRCEVLSEQHLLSPSPEMSTKYLGKVPKKR